MISIEKKIYQSQISWIDKFRQVLNLRFEVPSLSKLFLVLLMVLTMRGDLWSQVIVMESNFRSFNMSNHRKIQIKMNLLQKRRLQSTKKFPLQCDYKVQFMPLLCHFISKMFKEKTRKENTWGTHSRFYGSLPMLLWYIVRSSNTSKKLSFAHFTYYDDVSCHFILCEKYFYKMTFYYKAVRKKLNSFDSQKKLMNVTLSVLLWIKNA